ncbi:unnamed protein product [Effrenium voratum]|nr:unnamed protein product [Effrenium voratum]
MFSRRLAQLDSSGDRADILAIDGNAKLHRRTCGMPFAEVVPSPHLRKLLLRGCSSRPHGKDTLCKQHAAARDKQLPPLDPSSQVSHHRLRKTLHQDSDVCHFEFRGWQPACTIKEDVLAQHFARQADANIRRRRERRVQARKQKWTGMRPSSCKTHKESPKEAHAAARSAGYLLAVSESGLIFDMLEIIGAESLSQRYHFAAQVAHRLPRLQTMVHDDACHLKSMCLKERRTSVMAGKLADLNFIIDDFHSGGHCGEWCKTTCLPSLQQNKDILKGFPTEIAESVNAQFSPLGHCFHHYSPWFAQLVMQECADVHNMTRLQALGDKRRVADKKRKRQALAHSDRQAPVLAMPPHSNDALAEKNIDRLFRAALDVVQDNFHAADHLPKALYDFLLPIATSTCQGLYATAMLFLGSMPALSNGAVELMFETADDFVEVMAKVEIHGGCNKKEKAALRLWFGQAFNLDEAYEFLESLSLLGSRGDKAKDSSVNAHASTLNTHESLSPDMTPCRRGRGCRSRRSKLLSSAGPAFYNPGHFEGQEPGLENDEEGLRKAVRTEWRISGRWQVRDQTEHIQAGARRVCEYFAKRPHKTLELTDGAQKLLLSNQVAQAIRATNKDGQASMEALRANAAHQQGMMSAAVAILELAAGGGSFDESGQLQVTEDHVQVASRLVELSLQIREVLRGPVDAATAESSESDGELFKPVEVPAPQRRFAPPAATQLPTVAQPRAEEPLQHDEHVPVPLPESWPLQVADQPEEAEPPQPLRPSDLQPAEAFFDTGFGENGAMILPGKMQDRAFMSKLLLAGRSEVTLSKAVDVYHLLEVQGSKRRKIRPPQAKLLQAGAVVTAAQAEANTATKLQRRRLQQTMPQRKLPSLPRHPLADADA